MHILDTLSGIINLLLILSVLVVAHEWGHFIAAKTFGMRVEEFALFFGKILFRLGKRGDTEYNVRAIPLGGFVRIAGMEADDISGGRPILEALRNPPKDSPDGLAEVIRELDHEGMLGIDPAKVSDSVRLTLQAAIGPDGNLTEEGRRDIEALRSRALSNDERKLLDLAVQAHARRNDPALYSNKPIWQRATVIFAGPLASLLFGYFLFCIMGMTVGLPVGKLTNQIAVDPSSNSVAVKAGLQSGDRIVAVNGVPTPDGETLVKNIRPNAGKEIVLRVERGRQDMTFTVVPKATEIEEEPGRKKTVGLIGVIPVRASKRFGPVESVKYGTSYTIGWFYAFKETMLSRKAKDSIGGPIAMAQITTQRQRMGIAALAQLAAMFSLSLGIMNLLPIPILDGGHLLLLAVEKIRRRKLSPREVYRAQLVGMGMLALLFIFVMYNDIFRIISGRSF